MLTSSGGDVGKERGGGNGRSSGMAREKCTVRRGERVEEDGKRWTASCM